MLLWLVNSKWKKINEHIKNKKFIIRCDDKSKYDLLKNRNKYNVSKPTPRRSRKRRKRETASLCERGIDFEERGVNLLILLVSSG